MATFAETGLAPYPAPEVFNFETIDSTNAEALRYIHKGMRGPAWFAAKAQTAGRGRHARPWVSPQGNLYATLAVTAAIDPATATGLSFVAGLAAFETMAALADRHAALHLTLKWPNDIMLSGAKAAGILLETVRHPDGSGLAIALGTGINLGVAPNVEGRVSASLAKTGDGDWERALNELMGQTAHWFGVWDRGAGFAIIRDAWLTRAHKAGDALSVSATSGIVHGIFRGLDERGALQVETPAGAVIVITAGDVFSPL